MKHPSPPPPTDPLDRLFARLRREIADTEVDPCLPLRVEAAILRRYPPQARSRWLPRLAVGALVVLMALGVGSSTPEVRSADVAPPPELHGPVEPAQRTPPAPEATPEAPEIQEERPP